MLNPEPVEMEDSRNGSLIARMDTVANTFDDNYLAVMKSLSELRKSMTLLISRLDDYDKRITKLEIQMAQLTKPVKRKKARSS